MSDLYDWLERVREVLKYQDFDWVHLNTGGEGSGKSTLGLELCRTVDPDFSVDNVAFSAPDFAKSLMSLKPGSAVLLDEGGDALFAYDWASKYSKEVVKLLMRIRSRNLFACINVPYFHMISLYVRQYRVRSWSKALTFWDSKKHRYIRGYAAFYSKKQINKMHKMQSGKVIEPRSPTFYAYCKSLVGTPLWNAYLKKKQTYLSRPVEFEVKGGKKK